MAVARRLADDVLFPAAPATDALDSVPVSQFDVLADAGLYGLVGSVEHGGLAAAPETVRSVLEVMAGGCLTTTFVWAQHHGLVRALEETAPSPARDAWLRHLCRGERRAGLALGGLLPGAPRLRAEPVGADWVVHGASPWVSGWGLVDVLLVVARGPDDTLVWLIVDAAAGDGLSVERHRLVAVDASVTVTTHFDGLVVPGERLLRVEPYSDRRYNSADILRQNGFLALGVAGRCCRLLGATPFDDELVRCRERLRRADDEAIPPARAAASHLAVQTSAAFVVATGSRAIVRHEHPERLAREALFLLVFGTRPPIRAALLERFGAPLQ
jgi:alkylation response protein AidB-like acyl-CoA dehydrogenase